MTNAEYERSRFWKRYKEWLSSNGNPFKLAIGRQWAIVNRKTADFIYPCIAMDFLYQKHILRVNVYIQSDLELFDRLCGMRNILDADFKEKKPIWCFGEKGRDTRRIKIELPFNRFDGETYDKLIAESAEYVNLFIKNYAPYLRFE